MIVKSKRDWYYNFYAVCFVVSFFGPLIGVIPSIQKWGFNSSALFLLLIPSPLVFLFGLYLWRCGNIIKVDKFEKVISFKNVLLGLRQNTISMN